MPDVPGPAVGRRDSIILVLALLAGFAWSLASLPLMWSVYVAGWRPTFPANWPLAALHLAAIAAAPPTILVALLALCCGRVGRRARLASAGVVACVAAALVLAVQATQYPISRHVLLYDELTRFQRDARNNIIQYPRYADGLSWRTLAGSVGHDLGPGAGLAALGVLLGRRLARLPSAPAGPLDRVGRSLTAAWLLIEVGFWATGWP